MVLNIFLNFLYLVGKLFWFIINLSFWTIYKYRNNIKKCNILFSYFLIMSYLLLFKTVFKQFIYFQCLPKLINCGPYETLSFTLYPTAYFNFVKCKQNLFQTINTLKVYHPHSTILTSDNFILYSIYIKTWFRVCRYLLDNINLYVIYDGWTF